MCNCLSESLEKVKEMYPKWPDESGKEVEDMYYSNSGLNFSTGKSIHGIGIDIKFKDQKKLGHTFIIMSHCPLCGKKFEE
jgi:hypothetical protein